jgi:hypothetical protein
MRQWGFAETWAEPLLSEACRARPATSSQCLNCGPCAVNYGPRAVECGPRAVNCGPFAVNCGPCAVNYGPCTVDCGPNYGP